MRRTFRIQRMLAVRNIMSHKVASTIVGGIIAFGTFLVVVGASILDTIDESMAESIVSSLAGHLQIYSDKAQDDLALFGGSFMGEEDLDTLDDFKRIRERVESLENVKAVVPMGIQFHTEVPANDVDLAIARLRQAVADDDRAAIQAMEVQLRAMAEELEKEAMLLRDLSADAEEAEERVEMVKRVQTDAFWQALASDPEGTLTFLDTKLAELADSGEMLWLRNLGTDLHRFAELFDRFEILHGEMVPEGRRGFLFAERVYEDYIKNLAARELDRLHRDVTERGLTIARDTELASIARRLPGQYRRITFELGPRDTAQLSAQLKELLPDTPVEINEQIKAFLTVDDSNIEERHAYFYKEIAPRIRLYKVDVGDTLTVRSYTKSGYIRSANIKVYGVYRFKSLERSDLAGSQNLMDMVTFRELYGVMTPQMKQELAAIRQDVGAEALGRDAVEEALFGEQATIEEPHQRSERLDNEMVLEAAAPTDAAPYNQEQLDNGLALHAAVILHDATKLGATQQAIAELSDKEGLGLQVVDWQTASGMVGQLILVIRLVLYTAIFIIFLVALAIVNNSMVMATLDRIGEIGTMRAIGAQRSFVMMTFFWETFMLGLAAGAVGALLGAGTVLLLGSAGIPATSDIMVFLFSGPRLYPEVGPGNMLFGLVVILLVSLISTLYPAMIAARIRPVVAMGAQE